MREGNPECAPSTFPRAQAAGRGAAGWPPGARRTANSLARVVLRASSRCRCSAHTMRHQADRAPWHVRLAGASYFTAPAAASAANEKMSRLAARIVGTNARLRAGAIDGRARLQPRNDRPAMPHGRMVSSAAGLTKSTRIPRREDRRSRMLTASIGLQSAGCSFSLMCVPTISAIGAKSARPILVADEHDRRRFRDVFLAGELLPIAGCTPSSSKNLGATSTIDLARDPCGPSRCCCRSRKTRSRPKISR